MIIQYKQCVSTNWTNCNTPFISSFNIFCKKQQWHNKNKSNYYDLAFILSISVLYSREKTNGYWSQIKTDTFTYCIKCLTTTQLLYSYQWRHLSIVHCTLRQLLVTAFTIRLNALRSVDTNRHRIQVKYSWCNNIFRSYQSWRE